MKSAYNEIKAFGYEIEEIINEEMVKAAHDIPGISKEFDSAYIYGLLTSLKRIKEIIENKTDSKLANLINDNREYDEIINMLKTKDIPPKEVLCLTCEHFKCVAPPNPGGTFGCYECEQYKKGE